ncbi:hypothetical protein SDC9_57435 [bioreactor metagenome]|uniref:Uncharacterized protein n=1 Tax=bioreactor metagenome TaxID=1076179 RepID=A0A644X568_9ZZZZ
MLGSVVQQIAKHLLQPFRVCGDRGEVLAVGIVVQLDVLLAEQLPIGKNRVLKLAAKVHIRLHPQGKAPVLHLGKLQKLLHHGAQPTGLPQNDADALAKLRRVAGGICQNRLTPAVDGGKRGAQLVGHGGDKLRFHFFVSSDFQRHVVDIIHQLAQLVGIPVFNLKPVAPGGNPLRRVGHHRHRLHHPVDEQEI